MTHDEAIRKLNALVDDSEQDHKEAEEILLRYLDHHDDGEVADAFRAARSRVIFWYA